MSKKKKKNSLKAFKSFDQVVQAYFPGQKEEPVVSYRDPENDARILANETMNEFNSKHQRLLKSW